MHNGLPAGDPIGLIEAEQEFREERVEEGVGAEHHGRVTSCLIDEC